MKYFSVNGCNQDENFDYLSLYFAFLKQRPYIKFKLGIGKV